MNPTRFNGVIDAYEHFRDTGEFLSEPARPLVSLPTGLPMVALSIRQPWAWMIINGGKDIENRCWNTRFRGSVLVHAAKGMTVAEYTDARAFAHEVWGKTGHPIGVSGVTGKTIERGGIIGVVDVVDCVSASDSPWFVGEYGFVLQNPRPLPFFACKGALGFFRIEYPAEYTVTVVGEANSVFTEPSSDK